MAINPVSLIETLRPWHTAGITHFLAEVLPEEYRVPQTASPLPAQEAQPRSLAPQRPAQAAKTAPPPPAAKQAQQPSRPAPDVQTPQRLALEQWDASWRALLERTKPAPILWTYPELGLDLSGNGSKERGAYLRKLIGALNLPKGSSCFWPLDTDWASAKGESTIKTPNYFQQGVAALTPKVIVLFGPESVTIGGFAITLSTPFTQQIARGTLYVLLPDFESIMRHPDSPEKAAVFLRSVFAGFPGIY